MAGQHHGGHEESRPAPMSKDERVELILDVAERLFAQRGPEGVTVREIAAEAGISHALVHNYLGSKEELFKAVLMRDQQRILRAAEGADSLEVALPRIIAEVLGPTRSYATLVTHSAIHGMPWDAKVKDRGAPPDGAGGGGAGARVRSCRRSPASTTAFLWPPSSPWSSAGSPWRSGSKRPAGLSSTRGRSARASSPWRSACSAAKTEGCEPDRRRTHGRSSWCRSFVYATLSHHIFNVPTLAHHCSTAAREALYVRPPQRRYRRDQIIQAGRWAWASSVGGDEPDLYFDGSRPLERVQERAQPGEDREYASGGLVARE